MTVYQVYARHNVHQHKQCQSAENQLFSAVETESSALDYKNHHNGYRGKQIHRQR